MRPLILAPVLAVGACGVTPAKSNGQTPMEATSPVPLGLHAELAASLRAANDAAASVSEERRALLDHIASHVAARLEAGETARLLFICTHNSRRSHMGQLWAAAAAAYFGIDGVETFSGGTEATAFNPRAVAALQRAGFAIEAPDTSLDNPEYAVSLGEGMSSQVAYSKRYVDPPNPTEAFVAVMTCSDADEACPFVPGADLRVALPYIDPKVSDGTPDESATYDARSEQIAQEMVYLFSRVSS